MEWTASPRHPVSVSSAAIRSLYHLYFEWVLGIKPRSLRLWGVLVSFDWQLDTTQSHLRGENLNWRVASVRLACDQVCERLSWMMINEGGPSVAVTVPRPALWALWERWLSMDQWESQIAASLWGSHLEILSGCLQSSTVTWECKPSKYFLPQVVFSKSGFYHSNGEADKYVGQTLCWPSYLPTSNHMFSKKSFGDGHSL